jgi:hypothetical protein
MDPHEDVWHVQLESGEVRILTLDQLDAFYQNGIIDEETYILRDGTMEWLKLRDVLGESEPAAQPARPAAAPAVLSYGSVPPYQPPYQTHYSTRPVVSEIDPGELDDLDALPFKRSSKGKYILGVGAIGAVALMVAVLGANRIGKSAPEASVGAAVVNALPTTPAVIIPPPPPVVDPVAPALKDDVKKALADKDNQLNQKIEQRKQSRLKNAAPATHKASPPPFHKGGNAYDPLNAKL